MKRVLPDFGLVLLLLLPQTSLHAVTPYSSATLGIINSTNVAIDKATSITNPSPALVAGGIGMGQVGGNPATLASGNSRYFIQTSAFRVSDLLAALGTSNVADLANYTFTYRAVTDGDATNIDDACIYHAAYAGQWEDTGVSYTDVPLQGTLAVPNSQNMGNTPSATNAQRTLFCNAGDAISGFGGAAPVQIVNLGVFDAASTAQTLSASGFNLSGLATTLAGDSDLSNNYVFFAIYLNPKVTVATSLAQNFTSATLIPVENVDPKTIASNYEVAGPLITDIWGLKNLDHSGGTIRFELDPSGWDQLLVEGDYNHTGGDISIQLYSPPATGTAIPLLIYGGALTGTPAVSLVNDTRFALSASGLGDGSGEAVTATFAGAAADLIWTGSHDAAWDLNFTRNWKFGETPETFYNVDKVTFDDTATNFTPDIAGTLHPSAVVFNNNGANEYTLGGAGSIGGTATLSHTGDAKVTLLGNHGYTGATSVTNFNGTLQVGNGGSTGSIGSGPLSLTGEFIFDRSDNVVFTNATAGTNGLFTKKGAGMLTLATNHSGSLSYGVEGGTLRVGQGGAIGSLGTAGADVSAGATLEFFRNGSAMTIGNMLSGDGTVAFKGTGVSLQSSYSLTGANTGFAGTVIADAARLLIDQYANDLGSATAVKALSGGQILLSVAGDFACPLELQGDGWLETSGQLGALRLALSANVTGPITLAGNTRIGCLGSTGTLSGNISESGGARALELYNNSSIADAALTLAGTNSHSGGTTVRGVIATVQNVTGFGSGPVAVEANPVNAARFSGVLFGAVTIANPVTVAANSVVFGDGGTTGTVTLNGGVFAPGNSFPGILAAGNLVAQPGSMLDIRISSSLQSADLATVGGTVALESGVQLLVADLAGTPVGLANGTKLAILDYTGGSLTGTFDGLADGDTLVVGPNTFVIDYNDNTNGVSPGLFVTLTATIPITPFEAWAAAAGLDGTSGNEDGFGDDPDGDAVANGLEWILGGNPLASVGSQFSFSSSPAGLTLTFTHEEDSIGEANLAIEWAGGLQGSWTTVPIGAVSSNAANGVVITVSDGPSPDQVSVFIPASNAVGGKLFARLNANQP